MECDVFSPYMTPPLPLEWENTLQFKSSRVKRGLFPNTSYEGTVQLTSLFLQDSDSYPGFFSLGISPIILPSKKAFAIRGFR